MSPSNKKKTKRAPTLHDFFKKATPAKGPNQSHKLKPTPRRQSLLKLKPQTTASTTGRIPIPETIVIDSDSDIECGPAVATSKRKRQTRESDSDVEIVKSGPSGGRANVQAKLKTEHSPDTPTTTSLEDDTQVSVFGKPNHLLMPAAPEAQMGSVDHHATTLPSDSFGASTSSSSAVATATLNNDAISTGDLGIEADLTNLVDDRWAMGDDEQAVATEGITEDGDTNMDATITCPICEAVLHGLSDTLAQVHINECIDSVSSIEMESVADSSSVHGPQQLISCDGKTKSDVVPAPTANVKSRRGKSNTNRRTAPFYKILQGMPIAVDAFQYGTIPNITAYFLTHAHSDHYTNLSSTWTSGPIYCSEGTANLIVHMLSVDRKWVHALPMDTPILVPDTNGVHVTLIEANHCPGSCLFYFEGPQTRSSEDGTGSSRTLRYLHCGDFRASPRHVLHPVLKGKRIDHVYLDTTYLDPKYTFPPQPMVISACAELASRISSGQPVSKQQSVDSWMTPKDPEAAKKRVKTNRILIVIGTYSIGKERIVKAVADALKGKVYCDARKMAILRCQADTTLDALLTSDPLSAGIHLVPLGMITPDKLKPYLERFKGTFTKVVAFRPTGWSYAQPAGTDQVPSISTIIARSQKKDFTYNHLQPARTSTAAIQLYPVPYSEHSSFFELTCFAMSFNWGRMIATVNVGSERSRAKMATWVARWEAERKKRGTDEVIPHRQLDYW